MVFLVDYKIVKWVKNRDVDRMTILFTLLFFVKDECLEGEKKQGLLK